MKMKKKLGDVLVPKGSIYIHQILNDNQFNGCGTKIFNKFFEEVVIPSGGNLFLTLREHNIIACKFFEKNGMKNVSKILWKKGTIEGIVYHKQEINGNK